MVKVELEQAVHNRFLVLHVLLIAVTTFIRYQHIFQFSRNFGL
jgi:hypothetical protein